MGWPGNHTPIYPRKDAKANPKDGAKSVPAISRATLLFFENTELIGQVGITWTEVQGLLLGADRLGKPARFRLGGRQPVQNRRVLAAAERRRLVQIVEGFGVAALQADSPAHQERPRIGRLQRDRPLRIGQRLAELPFLEGQQAAQGQRWADIDLLERRAKQLVDLLG